MFSNQVFLFSQLALVGGRGMNCESQGLGGLADGGSSLGFKHLLSDWAGLNLSESLFSSIK